MLPLRACCSAISASVTGSRGSSRNAFSIAAAEAAGIRRVLLPARNEPDLRDVPEGARRGLEFVFLEDVGDVLEHALTPVRRRGSR